MSAYRRLNRLSRTLPFQHPPYTNAYQSTISNYVADEGGGVEIEHANGSVNGELFTATVPASAAVAAEKISEHESDDSKDTSINSFKNNIIAPFDDAESPLQEITQQLTANNNCSIAYSPQPKHIRFPDVPYNSELLNELMIFAYTIIATAMQFLHLYRTVWWLPESNTSQTMNFYLIDEHLTLFIVILLGRRFVYCFILKLLELLCPRHLYQSAIKFTRFAFFMSILVILGYLCLKMFPKQRYIVIYLCYPLIVYVITFGLKIEPFLRTIFEAEISTYFNGIPSHSCSTNPTTIRAEIDVLRADYNNRFKQVVFTSLLNAYYAAFIPCCFAQSFLYYDLYWATQHLGFLVLGSFTMCTMFCFPANYCDVMHMASLHLGKWIRIESRSYAPPAIGWSKLVVWPPGAFVKHAGELYKACGVVTTAIPANGIHMRFYVFFQNPANIYLMLSIIQSIIVFLQVIILFMVVEWHNIISLSYLLLANYHTLFKIVRDFFVANRMYTSETLILEKSTVSTLLN